MCGVVGKGVPARENAPAVHSGSAPHPVSRTGVSWRAPDSVVSAVMPASDGSLITAPACSAGRSRPARSSRSLANQPATCMPASQGTNLRTSATSEKFPNAQRPERAPVSPNLGIARGGSVRCRPVGRDCRLHHLRDSGRLAGAPGAGLPRPVARSALARRVRAAVRNAEPASVRQAPGRASRRVPHRQGARRHPSLRQWAGTAI